MLVKPDTEFITGWRQAEWPRRDLGEALKPANIFTLTCEMELRCKYVTNLTDDFRKETWSLFFNVHISGVPNVSR